MVGALLESTTHSGNVINTLFVLNASSIYLVKSSMWVLRTDSVSSTSSI